MPRVNLRSAKNAKAWAWEMPLAVSIKMLACVCLAATIASPVAAQTARQDFDGPAMRTELLRLAKICTSLGLDHEAELSSQWLPAPRGDQRNYYLPGEFAQPQPENPQQAYWVESFNAARINFADHLYARAVELIEETSAEVPGERQLSADDYHEADAFRLLWQVLRENPDHVQARRILGPLATAATVRPRLRRATTAHPEFGWPANSYSRIETPHFALTTRAAPQASLELARQLETIYALWEQVFYPLWSPPGLLALKFQGSNRPWPKQAQMDAYLLKDRQDYLTVLGVGEENIGVSVGYYTPLAKKSFFYPGDSLSATLVHELTHQLLAEATHIDARENAGDKSGIWLLEGIALYMESLADRGGYWTLGGLESPRLQTARYRALRDGYWVDWNSFVSASKDQWKQDPEIARLYTHAVGLVHTFMDGQPDRQPQARQALLQAVVGVYQNQGPNFELLNFLGKDDTAAQRAYQQALTLEDKHLQALAACGRQPESLVLTGSNLSSSTWQSLAQQRQLQWLDVTFSNATSTDLKWLADAQQLRRLSVEGCDIDVDLLHAVQGLAGLQELDLSRCAIDDEALRTLSGHPGLETLWLTQTQVSDASLKILASMPQLKFCDVQGTRIQPASWRAFQETQRVQ